VTATTRSVHCTSIMNSAALPRTLLELGHNGANSGAGVNLQGDGALEPATAPRQRSLHKDLQRERAQGGTGWCWEGVATSAALQRRY
jgi:hypothetical protein